MSQSMTQPDCKNASQEVYRLHSVMHTARASQRQDYRQSAGLDGIINVRGLRPRMRPLVTRHALRGSDLSCCSMVSIQMLI